MMKPFETVVVETNASRDVQRMLDQMRVSRTVGLLLGTTGQGKTTMLRAWYMDMSRSASLATRPVLLYRAEVVNTPLSVLRGLLHCLDAECVGGTRQAFTELSVEMQMQRVEMIVVDDADRLARHSLDALRGLLERTHVALVLCGAPRFKDQLPARCPQLAHRVATVHQVVPAQDDDAYAVVRHAPTLQRRNFGDALALSRTLVDESAGNLRRMTQLLDEAQRRARAEHRSITPRLLQRAGDDLSAHTISIARGA